MATKSLVSIVIPTFGRHDQLLRLLDSIYDSSYPKNVLEIIIVDNKNDINEERIKEKTRIIKTLIRKQKFNLMSGGARRIGADISEGDYILFIDDDNIVDPKCIELLVESFKQYPKLGIAAPLMLVWNDKTKVWCAGANFKGKAFMFAHQQFHNHQLADLNLPEIIYGADYFPNAFMVKREALNKVKFDHVNFPSAWNETDFGLRVKKLGFELATITKAREWHDIDYTGLTTRVHRAIGVYNRTQARILFRKRFYNTIANWLVFWLILFPTSTLYYLMKIALVGGDKKTARIKAYLKGTVDGVRRPLKDFEINEYAQ